MIGVSATSTLNHPSNVQRCVCEDESVSAGLPVIARERTCGLLLLPQPFRMHTDGTTATMIAHMIAATTVPTAM